MDKITVNIEKEEKTILQLKKIEFDKNIKLMNYINYKYPNYNFYTMSGPVDIAANGKDVIVIDAKSRQSGFTVSLNTSNEELEDSEFVINSIIIPIIDEVVHNTESKDIYLYTLLPTGPVKDPVTLLPVMSFLIRGSF